MFKKEVHCFHGYCNPLTFKILEEMSSVYESKTLVDRF